MRTKDQTTLGFEDTDTFTKQEQKIRALLRKYLILPERIAHFEMLSHGDGLLHQPSVTAAPPSEDDPWVLVELAMHEYTEKEQDIIRLVGHLLSPQGFTYATKSRVAGALSKCSVDDKDDEELRKMVVAMLLETLGEEYVELTDTERLAIMREREILRARQIVATLRDELKWLKHALGTMEKNYPNDYAVLWQRYVLDKPVREVCDALSLDYERDRELYKKRLRRAMEQFAKWLPGYMIN